MIPAVPLDNDKTLGDVRIRATSLSKTFTLHAQGGVVISVFTDIDLTVRAGECVCLHGQSGVGKSTLLKSLYANYKLQAGAVLVQHDDRDVDLVTAEPWQIIEIRRRTIGYVSQFLRVIPRIPAIDIVAERARENGLNAEEARAAAQHLLARLNIPERLWYLAPATFSGGEQQRINIARSFITPFPILLLDEPTASLDAANRKTVISLIQEAKARNAAVVGIFHDAEVREAVADSLFDLEKHQNLAA
jgi:alpha-D-ribose 1-methylphosphonate 5-triphosphate synthase subunit PhnL